jgi:hypothetical protein
VPLLARGTRDIPHWLITPQLHPQRLSGRHAIQRKARADKSHRAYIGSDVQLDIIIFHCRHDKGRTNI